MSAIRHILLVDDEREFLFSAALALKIAGFQVSTVESGEEAIAMIADAMSSGSPVDLLVTDMQMPGMNGKMLMERLRETWPGLPIFVVTGHFHKDLDKELAEHGCLRYLIKPFNPSEFAERITRYMKDIDSSGATAGAGSG